MNWFKEFISYYFNSPFIRPSIKFYIGKVSIGVPYFYPRRWVNNKYVPKKIGFDFCRLGWKTKYGEYRFEWNPILSFVFFKWQLAIIISAPEPDHYWECWLYYQKETDKSKSKMERAIDCQKNNPQIWTMTQNGQSEKINYYKKVLKKKYIIPDIDELRDKKIDDILK